MIASFAFPLSAVASLRLAVHRRDTRQPGSLRRRRGVHGQQASVITEYQRRTIEMNDRHSITPSKSREPMRTIVAPSAIASRKSPLMPIDKCGNGTPV